MVELIGDLRAPRIRANLERLQEEIAAAAADSASNRGGRDEVEMLAATKYVAAEDLPVLPRRASGWSVRTAPRTCRRRSRPTGSCSSGTSSASCRAAGCG